MTKREIYYILLNKHLKPDGKFEADTYTVGESSAYQGKIPESIEVKSGKVIVTFTDKDRHIFPYNDGVEFFDRIVKPKTDAKQTTD